ncbi:C1 family peptidase [Flavobacterium croceum]|uniref:C1 family peptidase n=1 Tax=Flavobacterium croceum TaxID=370975 RepID=UPI0024A828C3|nr:C1 family peptidase [Flavobacterium croceum]
MKKNILSCFLLCLGTTMYAQTYQFQTVKDITSTPVISQDNTGTCWSFSTTSFLEAEIIRTTGKQIDLSEMYNVRNTYPKKAWNYIMRQGKAQFGEGALAHDVINSARDFGIVPENVYEGNKLEGKYNHAEMVAVLESMLKTYVSNPGKKLSSQWKDAVNAVLDVYMGKNPTDFTYEGKKYTPKTFLESTKLDLHNYVTLSSFTNFEYNKPFLLDIPDNFSNGIFYNVTLDEYIQNIDNAIDNGYTIALDCDVSEPTFSGRFGLAVIPEHDTDNTLILTEIKPEKNITPELRQQEFENLSTQDDHLMHIVGKVKDQNGKIYYKVKNSWGTKSGKEGYVYMSVAYIRLKSISVLMCKDALVKKTKTNLGL